MSFLNATRRKLIRLGTQTQAAGNPVSWDIPKTGILSRIFLDILVSPAGTLSAPNALGGQCLVNRVKLIANSGINVFDVSGSGYFSGLLTYMEQYITQNVQAGFSAAIATGVTHQLNMVIPVAMNSRDPIGLIMLQNEQTLLQLTVEFLAFGSVATGCTSLPFSITPTIEVFTVPTDPRDWPPFNVIHQVVEDVRAIASAGTIEYYWPRGNTYLQVIHGAGWSQANTAENWTRAQLRLNQSDYLMDFVPMSFDQEYASSHGYIRRWGTVAFDLMGSSGLGMFGSSRDMLYSAAVTDLASVIAIAAAGNLYTVRRQLISLEG
jgi:hypothetical protein